MAYLPVRRYRHFDDPFDRFFESRLDFFDPWPDFHWSPLPLSTVPRFRWIPEPRRISHTTHTSTIDTKYRQLVSRASPSVKFRVESDVADFNADTIKTRVDGRKVIVEAKQEDRQSGGDFTVREIRKTYELPENADAGRLASYVTPNNTLVIEAPIQNPENERRLTQVKNDQQTLALFGQHREPSFDHLSVLGRSDFQSRNIVNGNNMKQLEITVPMRGFKPEEIKVSVKDNDLVVQGEHENKNGNRSERSSVIKSTTLPPGIQVDQLQSRLGDDGELKIEVPYTF